MKDEGHGGRPGAAGPGSSRRRAPAGVYVKVGAMSELSLVLADEHHLVREGLRMLLEARLPCRVVGEAATGPEALALLHEHQPDILIAALTLPELGGVDLARAARDLARPPQVLLVAAEADELDVRDALRAGVLALVLTDSPASDFLHAVAQVAAGRRYLSPRLADYVFSAFAHNDGSAVPAQLSPREREVLRLVAQGLTSAAIASRLGIGGRTVEWHRARLQQKLGLHSVAELVRYAIEHRMLAEVD